MATKLDKFDYDLTENYYLKNLIENDFWLFGSFAGVSVKPLSTNAPKTARDFIDKTIFGIQIEPRDLSFMLPIIVWRQDVVYAAYDDQAILDGTNFYVVVEPEIDGGDYHIFKCISNARNTTSVNKPEFTNSIADGIYELPDGYIWKYMSSTPFVSFRRFSARNLMPVVRNASVEAVADDGIFSVVVENTNTNKGYELIAGTVESFDSITGIVYINSTAKLDSSDGSQFSSIQAFDFSTPNFYLNRSLYIRKNETSSILETEVFEIIESGILNSRPFIRVQPNTFIEAFDIIQIAPTIQIRGNGTGAIAMPVFEAGRIVSTRMLSYGTGYTRATATILDPTQAFDVTQGAARATLRAIISPDDGHGTNIFRELKCKQIGIAKSISSGVGFDIPSVGTYSKIAVVKKPVFETEFDSSTFDNRIKLTSNSSVAAISVGQTVRQGNVQGIVHEVDTGTNTIYVSDYTGPYSETFVDTAPIDIGTGGISINTIEYSPYIGDTGDVLFIADSVPIQRTEDKVEQIRLIIDF